MNAENENKKKLMPADKVIDRIKWDANLNKDDYIICYEDRFLGNMEVPYADYVLSEAKSHRVRYIKKKGEIVWDRQNRIDNIGY